MTRSALLATLLLPAVACACACPSVSAEVGLASADAAFAGTVMRKVPVPNLHRGGPRPWYIVEVERAVKGSAYSIEFVPFSNEFSCEIDFKVGERYLFVRGANGQFDRCSGTRVVSSKDALLSRGGPPKPIGWFVSAGVLFVMFAVWLFARMLRHRPPAAPDSSP